MSTFTTHLARFPDSPLWGYYLPVPGDIGQPFVEGDDRRVIVTLDGELTLHLALMPQGGEFFLFANKAVRSQLQLEIGDAVEVKLEKDRSEYGMPMPEELQVMLEQDELAYERFHALTPGKQRALIYLVSKVKRVESRINKALAIAEHLRTNSGTLDFKVLNQLIKQYNQRQ